MRRSFLTPVLAISIVTSYLFGCAAAPMTSGLKPVNNAPNLVGQWEGVYQGFTINMLVQKQQGPSFAATISSPAWGDSHETTGTIGAGKDGTLWVVTEFGSGKRHHRWVMKIVSDGRLEGTDESLHHGVQEAVYFNRE